MNNFKWVVAALAFVLTLIFAVGVVHFRQNQLINEPLFKRISEMESVETVNLQQEGSTQVITVKLANVEDFPGVYRKLNEEISKLLGQKSYSLMLLDERNHVLEAAFYAAHLALYEGERWGNFVEMGDRVNQTMSTFGIESYSLFVDSQYIYIKIEKGEAYLYETVKRYDSREAGERV